MGAGRSFGVDERQAREAQQLRFRPGSETDLCLSPTSLYFLLNLLLVVPLRNGINEWVVAQVSESEFLVKYQLWSFSTVSFHTA